MFDIVALFWCFCSSESVIIYLGFCRMVGDFQVVMGGGLFVSAVFILDLVLSLPSSVTSVYLCFVVSRCSLMYDVCLSDRPKKRCSL